MVTSESDVRCPKCGAPPGKPCQSIRQGGRIGTWPYEFHKKRTTVILLGAPSTELFAVPVRVRTLKRRSRVGAVDSAMKTLPEA